MRQELEHALAADRIRWKQQPDRNDAPGFAAKVDVVGQTEKRDFRLSGDRLLVQPLVSADHAGIDAGLLAPPQQLSKREEAVQQFSVLRLNGEATVVRSI